MALSDCEKCWSTPCECGYNYKDWTVTRLKNHIKMLKSVLADKLIEDDPWDRNNPGNR